MFGFDKDGKRMEIWWGYFTSGGEHKYPADSRRQDESSIPLLVDAVLDIKHQNKVTDVRPEYDGSSSDVVSVIEEEKKVPWWSYIWVRKEWNLRPILLLTPPRIMTQQEPATSEGSSKGSTSSF
jgi:hypothetical protein